MSQVRNEAQAERAAARAQVEGAPAPNLFTDAEVYAMIDSLGDVDAALSGTKPDTLEGLYTRCWPGSSLRTSGPSRRGKHAHREAGKLRRGVRG